MTHATARLWWARFIAGLVVLFAAIGLGAILQGCEVGAEDAPIEEIAEDEQPTLTDEETAELFQYMRDVAASRPAGDGLIHLDAPTPEGRAKYSDPKPTGDVEKGAYPMLTGWGIKPCLAFQDGVPGSCGFDHCSLYGLSCDDMWHAQANTTNFANYTHFLENFTGTCAPNIVGKAWNPCMLPALTSSFRVRTFFIDDSQCGGSNIVKRLFRDAALRRLAFLRDYADIEFVEDSFLTANTNDIIRCGPDSEVGSDVGGHWAARGDITLKYALQPALGDFSLDFNEFCETPGFPGSGTPAVYNQAIDMHYTYSHNDIVVNMSAMLGKINECATSEIEIRHGLEWVLLHEMGHAYGLHHNENDSDIQGTMYGYGRPCEDITGNSPGFSQFELNAILDLDTSTDSDTLELIDEDLSCLLPF